MLTLALRPELEAGDAPHCGMGQPGQGSFSSTFPATISIPSPIQTTRLPTVESQNHPNEREQSTRGEDTEGERTHSHSAT